jgi:hypothetical protein
MPDVGCSGIPNVFTNLDEAAHMAGVERIELLGALNQIEFDTGRQVQPKDYLYSTGQPRHARTADAGGRSRAGSPGPRRVAALPAVKQPA